MVDLNKDIPSENLTQKDIVQLLLHNAQHMVTREELKSDIKELKDELKSDIKELRNELKQDISKVEASLKQDIAKVNAKFDKIQWLIFATMLTVLFKDYIFSFIQVAP